MIAKNSTILDVAFTVCTAMDRTGVRAVLTGGSAATVYAPEAYQSDDLDFVITFGSVAADKKAREALDVLGFVEKPRGGGVFFHPQSMYSLEFPPGPLAVGGDFIFDYDTMQRGDQVLHIISPTDSVRNRLMWLYHSQSRDVGSLRAAVGIALAQRPRIDLALIEDWSKRESVLMPNAMRRFREFVEALRS